MPGCEERGDGESSAASGQIKPEHVADQQQGELGRATPEREALEGKVAFLPHTQHTWGARNVPSRKISLPGSCQISTAPQLMLLQD